MTATLPASELEDFGPTSHSFISQRLKLAYVDWGNRKAPPLLLQHGGRDHSRSWDWIARELRHDWHVIAPDLRGHGDSAWSPDGGYAINAFVYDLAQLIHQEELAPLTIVAHSFGAMIALRYAGAFPTTVRKLVAIEGTGLSSSAEIARLAAPTPQRWRAWVEERRKLSGRLPRRYASIEEALGRMQAENRYLTDEQARHLTIHGVSRNEDGTYSWKFDNYVRSGSPVGLTEAELEALNASIVCPVLVCQGRDSWATDPAQDGTTALFKDAKVVNFDQAGHWLHHDQTARFMETLRGFL